MDSIITIIFNYIMAQELNYEGLLFGDIDFTKINDKVTIPLDDKVKNDILTFVKDLNDKNIDYEKKGKNLIVSIELPNKQDNIEIQNDQKMVNQNENSIIKDLYTELYSLNLEYNQFMECSIHHEYLNTMNPDYNKYAIYIKISQDNLQNYWIISLVDVNGHDYIQISYENKKQLIFCDKSKPRVVNPTIVYVTMYLMKQHDISVNDKKIKFCVDDKHISKSQRLMSKKFTYLGENRWNYRNGGVKYFYTTQHIFEKF